MLWSRRKRALHLVLHWQGGDHTRLEVLKNRSGQNRFKTDAATEQLVCELARLLPDHSIAPVLNRLGVRSARGQTWTQLRVRNFRGAHQIPVYRERERAERHELIPTEATSRLDVSKITVVRLIRDGLLPARRVHLTLPGDSYSICFQNRSFDRIPLNGLIQPFLQPEMVIGFRRLPAALPGEPRHAAGVSPMAFSNG